MASYASYMNSPRGNQYRSRGYRGASHRGYAYASSHTFTCHGSPKPTARAKPAFNHRPKYADSMSYQRMARNYSRVVEQERLRKAERDKRMRQQEERRRVAVEAKGWRAWCRFAQEQRKRAEARARQKQEAERQKKEKEKLRAQEERKRAEARARQKREAERQKKEKEKLRAQMEAREKERVAAQNAIVDAWKRYEHGWDSLLKSTKALGFRDIPWPVKSIPNGASDITPAAVVNLLLSPLHSMKQSGKDRIRSAQLRWHPDKFHRLMGRVKAEDKQAVEEGVGIIARCLNDLMSKEQHRTSSS